MVEGGDKEGIGVSNKHDSNVTLGREQFSRTCDIGRGRHGRDNRTSRESEGTAVLQTDPMPVLQSRLALEAWLCGGLLQGLTWEFGKTNLLTSAYREK
jgi:hypothetical protein